MTCLYLNPSLDKSSLLDATQVASMNIHIVEALKVAQDLLFPSQKRRRQQQQHNHKHQPQQPLQRRSQDTSISIQSTCTLLSAMKSGRDLLILHSALTMLLLNSRHVLH
jgi:hypothetical protein